jgi:ankyrin repeat protein
MYIYTCSNSTLFFNYKCTTLRYALLGNTPLHLAISEGHENIAIILIEYGHADVHAMNNDKQSCLDIASPQLRRRLLATLEKP